ncbi:major facilitator superfamily domain-containing protein [Xylariomycetidae sp. FL0641]|nr:major facilitator superfamily domain-containing protein [Xylariomycetidae sp. FL0641]
MMEKVQTGKGTGAEPSVAERKVDSNGESVPSTADSSQHEVTWTQHEERMVRLKLDCYLMPLLILGFFVLQLDRSNISNALTDTLLQDVHITKGVASAGASLMAAGVVVAEIPANLLLQKLGAPVWLTTQMLLWGAIATGQTWVNDKKSFLATRFLLGIFEGGYIPGSQYVLALFYTETELATRTAVFYFGNYFSSATGSLIAAGILKMGGQNGLAGWQWLFLIEGILTLGVFVVFVLFLPGSPGDTRPVHRRFDLFSAREREIMSARVLAQDRTKAGARARIGWGAFREAALDGQLWLHALLNVVALMPKGGLQLYGPSIIQSLGFGQYRANLLNSVSSYIVVVLALAVSLASDRTRLRGPWCVAAFLWSLAFAGALLGTPLAADKWRRYALFTLLSGGNALAQGLNDAWVNINATTAARRSVGLAFVVMGSNIGGLIGPFLFQDYDSPRYVRGFLAVLLLYAASILVTLLIMALYTRKNRAAAARKQQQQQEHPGEPVEKTRPFQI